MIAKSESALLGLASLASADSIRRAVACRLGLTTVMVPELNFPLWLRAGTGDAAACIRELAVPALRIPYQPRRILEIGSGAGYRSVGLAIMFPDAEILTAEDDAELHRLNLLNTLPYRNVSTVHAALSDQPLRYAKAGRSGLAGYPSMIPVANGPEEALPLSRLLAERAWEQYDTVIISPDAMSSSLLHYAWPESVRLIAVFTGGDVQLPDLAEYAGRSGFLLRREGDYLCLLRQRNAARFPPLSRMAAFDPLGPLADLALVNVPPEPWGFFTIGADGFRLHPNNGSGPDATLVLSYQGRGQHRLQGRLRLAPPNAQPVKFGIGISAEADGAEICRITETLSGGEERDISASFTPCFGRCRMVFTTSMASPAGHNGSAWAEFLDLAFS